MITPGTDEWFKAREGRLTASDFGAALGLNPFCSPQKLWRIKVGVETVENNFHMQRGTDNEAQAIFGYEVAAGVLTDEVGLVLHPTCDWIAGTPDAAVGDDGLVEVKCPAQVRSEPPQYHLAQIQGQLEITDRSWCDYVQWHEGTITIIRVERDREWWARALPVLAKFWAYVTMMEPPPRGSIKMEKQAKQAE